MNLKVFINEKSGAVAALNRDDLKQALKDNLELHDDGIHFLSPEAVSSHLKRVNDGEHVLVGGGDGTIQNACSVLGPKKIPFGIIPLGTMNMFAKDLGLELDPLKLIPRYSKTTTAQIDVAIVNEEMFLCSAMVGVPTAIAKHREGMRNKETPLTWVVLFKKLWEKLTHRKGRLMSISAADIHKSKPVKAVVISNNEYELHSSIDRIKKKSLKSGVLGVYTINPQGSMESLQLLGRLAIGDWDSAPALEHFNADRLELNMKRKHVNVLLDGELFKMQTPLKFRSKPQHLRIILPDG